jgi:hypothetical protein
VLVLQLSSNFLFSVSVRCITTVHAAQGRYIDWFLLLNSYIEAVTPAALRFWSLRCLRDTTRPSTQIWSSVSGCFSFSVTMLMLLHQFFFQFLSLLFMRSSTTFHVDRRWYGGWSLRFIDYVDAITPVLYRDSIISFFGRLFTSARAPCLTSPP